jgi:hypothetical protein
LSEGIIRHGRLEQLTARARATSTRLGWLLHDIEFVPKAATTGSGTHDLVGRFILGSLHHVGDSADLVICNGFACEFDIAPRDVEWFELWDRWLGGAHTVLANFGEKIGEGREDSFELWCSLGLLGVAMRIVSNGGGLVRGSHDENVCLGKIVGEKMRREREPLPVVEGSVYIPRAA